MIGIIAFYNHFPPSELENLTIEDTNFYSEQIKKNLERKYGNK